jgi:hypothetical protein
MLLREKCIFIKSTAMRKPDVLPAVLILFLLATASITWAQSLTSLKGLTTASFPTPYGEIKIYLPDDIRPGETISGSVSVFPDGKSIRQTEKNLAELKRYRLQIDELKIDLAVWRFVPERPSGFQWIIPKDREVSIPVELIHVSDSKPAQLTYRFHDVQDTLPALKGCYIPAHVLEASPLRIHGAFDGEYSNTKCTLENRQLEILAESPRQSIFLIPPGVSGIKNISILENSSGKTTQCYQQSSLVQLHVSAGKLNLKKGEQTFIDVKITGLKDLQDTAMLSLKNASGDVVSMIPSNKIEIPLAPDSVSSGDFKRRFYVQSLKTGSFTVNVNLDLPENSGEPFQFEVKDLKEPRKLENTALQTGLHQALKKMMGDAGGAAGKEWDNVCDNCKQCVEARLGTWAEDLVEKLGMDILKEFAGKAVSLIGDAVKSVGAAKEFFDKMSDKTEKTEELAKSIEDKIRTGELQVMDFKPAFCQKSQYCLISGIIFYNPQTGCVLAVLKCEGTKLCCPEAQTKVVISYCTDEYGMPSGKPQITVFKT